LQEKEEKGMIFFSLEEKLRNKLKMKSFTDHLNKPHEPIDGRMGDFSFFLFSQIFWSILIGFDQI
jgi:hypothetical protein